jgi:colanic acid/amylovoran biosynthesis protein
MLLINFIHYFSKASEYKHTFYVELQSDDDFQRLKNQIDDDIKIINLGLNITSYNDQNIFGKLAELIRKLFMDRRYFKMIGISAIVILGGDDLSEYYKGWKIVSDLYRIKLYSSKIPVYLVGQTIGPFKSWRIGFAKKCLKNAKIYFRDKSSLNKYKQSVNTGFTMLGADLALLELPNKIAGNEILKNLNLEENKYIIIVPSGFSELYTNNRESYIECWSKILDNLLADDGLANYKFFFLPHVTWPEDDRLIINEIIKKLNRFEERIIFENKEYTPDIARYFIGKSYFVISGRMHPAVSAFQQKKPAITLAYSIKFNGVVGESFGLENLIVNCEKSSDWVTHKVVDELKNKITYLNENYQNVLEIIDNNIGEQIQLAQNQVNDIAFKINN